MLSQLDIPTQYMLDGVWEKGAAMKDMSCMKEGKLQRNKQGRERNLNKSIEKAKDIDARIERLMTLEGN